MQYIVCMQCKNTEPISKHQNFFLEKLRRSRFALRFAPSVLNIYYTLNHDEGLAIIVIYLNLTQDFMFRYIKKKPGLFSNMNNKSKKGIINRLICNGCGIKLQWPGSNKIEQK